MYNFFEGRLLSQKSSPLFYVATNLDALQISLESLCFSSGWAWEAEERPTFAELHQHLEAMSQSGSFDEGESFGLCLMLGNCENAINL